MSKSRKRNRAATKAPRLHLRLQDIGLRSLQTNPIAQVKFWELREGNRNARNALEAHRGDIYAVFEEGPELVAVVCTALAVSSSTPSDRLVGGGGSWLWWAPLRNESRELWLS